ncbi:MAG TPA: PilN domain-containing protein [Candidatus Dormibacteraeota bacterium]|nr:PilN domain-containing protein [Candidatus Dormibacteraeota bacterium]
MVNLLPPDIKFQVEYSKKNARLIRYIKIIVLLAVVIGGMMVGGRMYLEGQIAAIDKTNREKNEQIAKSKELETSAKAINSRLVSIQSIQKNQAKFSLLLSDLAAATPSDVAIDTITLTGDDKKPVRIDATAKNYRAGLSFRESLARSTRIGAADLESITQSEGGQHKVVVTIAFNAGQSR